MYTQDSRYLTQRTRTEKNRSKSPEKTSPINFKIAAKCLMRGMKPVRITDLSSLRKKVLLIYA